MVTLQNGVVVRPGSNTEIVLNYLSQMDVPAECWRISLACQLPEEVVSSVTKRLEKAGIVQHNNYENGLLRGYVLSAPALFPTLYKQSEPRELVFQELMSRRHGMTLEQYGVIIGCDLDEMKQLRQLSSSPVSEADTSATTSESVYVDVLSSQRSSRKRTGEELKNEARLQQRRGEKDSIVVRAHDPKNITKRKETKFMISTRYGLYLDAIKTLTGDQHSTIFETAIERYFSQAVAPLPHDEMKKYAEAMQIADSELERFAPHERTATKEKKMIVSYRVHTVLKAQKTIKGHLMSRTINDALDKFFQEVRAAASESSGEKTLPAHA